MSAASFPWVRFTGFSLALMGAGYGLMKATTPTEQQLYDEMSPDLRRKVDLARAARLAREEATKKQIEAQTSAEQSTDNVKPIWADPPQRK